MDRLTVDLGDRTYQIAIGARLSDLGIALISGEYGVSNISPRIALISNDTVYGLYGKPVEESLNSAGFDTISINVPDGEEYKNLQWTEFMLTELLKHRLDRGSLVVALGGGVIGDMAGFAASVYMRGIRFIQVPTTLLSQVDSSVGGKTGVNHPLGKNMIGTFWQPSLVWIDIETLNTLPESEVRAGLAEVIKYGVIRDAVFFNYLKTNKEKIIGLEPNALSHIIKSSCSIKADIVSIDERESGLRAVLNFGHTIGHSIEAVTGFMRYLHGEAVAIGMCSEARLSASLGYTSKEAADDICEIIGQYGLPIKIDSGLETEALLTAMEIDKKAVSGSMRFVLPEKTGKCLINVTVSKDALLKHLSNELL